MAGVGGKVGGSSTRVGSGGGGSASFSSSRGGGGSGDGSMGGSGEVEMDLTLAGTEGVCVRAVFGTGATGQDTISMSLMLPSYVHTQ